NYLAKELKKLNIEDEYELKWDKENKNGIMSTKFNVILNETDNHSSNTDHHHGHHTDSIDHHYHHRTYKSIVKMINNADFSDRVKTIALNIFKTIGESEGRIHGMPLDDVHF